MKHFEHRLKYKSHTSHLLEDLKVKMCKLGLSPAEIFTINGSEDIFQWISRKDFELSLA